MLKFFQIWIVKYHIILNVKSFNFFWFFDDLTYFLKEYLWGLLLIVFYLVIFGWIFSHHVHIIRLTCGFGWMISSVWSFRVNSWVLMHFVVMQRWFFRSCLHMGQYFVWFDFPWAWFFDRTIATWHQFYPNSREYQNVQSNQNPWTWRWVDHSHDLVVNFLQW